jgi:hypothetical protein
MGEYVWNLELFSSLEMLTILEERFMTHLYSPEDVLRLRAQLELAAW